MVVNNKAVRFRHSFKSGIVVRSISASVLYMMNVAVVVADLMEEGSADVFNRTIKGSRSNIDFMGAAQRRNPGILSKGEVTISSGGTLDCYSGPGKFPRKIVLVEQVKNMVEVACYSVIGRKLFHSGKCSFQFCSVLKFLYMKKDLSGLNPTGLEIFSLL